MKLASLLLCAALAAAAASAAEGAELRLRRVSTHKQFTVYCNNDLLRVQAAGAAAEVKAGVLALLNEKDGWQIPVVISLDKAAAPRQAVEPVRLQFIETPEGPKIQINVQIGDDPAAIHLRKHIVRAVLLDFMYRSRGGVKGGEAYLEAPWWLVEGIVQLLRQRESGVDTDFFRRLIETNKLPPIDEFLNLRSADVGATALAVDAACAMCFVQLLMDQPGGKANLARFLQEWPRSGGDTMGALARQFPEFSNVASLQKWWTVNLARLSAADRYKGLSLEETGRELEKLLNFKVVANKAGEKKEFTMTDAEQFAKLPGSKAAMLAFRGGLMTLSTRAHALLRPVLADYSELALQVQRGKTRGVRERVAQIETYRAAVLHRMSDIADYLNWYEATQIGVRSKAFDSYLKAANRISEAEAQRKTPVADYLDQLEQEL